MSTMKYLNLEIENGKVFSIKTLQEALNPEFPRKLNFTETFRVLEEQCRPLGLQPEIYIDCIRIVPASKKFIRQERRYNQPLSSRAKEYIAFCSEAE